MWCTFVGGGVLYAIGAVVGVFGAGRVGIVLAFVDIGMLLCSVSSTVCPFRSRCVADAVTVA